MEGRAPEPQHKPADRRLGLAKGCVKMGGAFPPAGSGEPWAGSEQGSE